MSQATSNGVEAHYHKMILMSGKVLEISSKSESKLDHIKIEGFEDHNMHFFKNTIDNPDQYINKNVSFGMVDFFISKELNYPEDEEFQPNEKKSERGSLIFDISINKDENRAKVNIQNYLVSPIASSRMGGTRACSPVKFMDSNGMIEYIKGSYSYFPMLTFADNDNPIGNCYFSFFKCLSSGNHVLRGAHIDKMYGLDDDPMICSDAKVLVHQELATVN